MLRRVLSRISTSTLWTFGRNLARKLYWTSVNILSKVFKWAVEDPKLAIPWLSFLLSGIVFLAFVFLEYVRDPIAIYPFDVSPALEARGYTGQVVARRVLDQMNKIKAGSSLSPHTEFRLALPETEPDLELRLVGLSLKPFVDYLRGLSGSPRLWINGEISIDDEQSDRVVVRMRVLGWPHVETDGLVVNLDKPLQEAVSEIYKYIDPVTYTRYQCEVSSDSCIEKIEKIIQDDNLATEKSQLYWMYVLWGNRLSDLEEYEDAIRKYQRAIEIDPKQPGAYYNLGVARYERKEYNTAIEMFQEALRLEGSVQKLLRTLRRFFSGKSEDDYLDSRIGLAASLRACREYDDAMKIFEKFVVPGTRSASAYNHWGLTIYAGRDKLFDENETDEAIEQAIDKYKMALDIGPKYTNAYGNLGIASYTQKKYDDAISYYKKALEINSELARAHVQWGQALYQLKRYKAAIWHYEEALKIDPENARAYKFWGEALKTMGDSDGAAEKYRKADRLDETYGTETGDC